MSEEKYKESLRAIRNTKFSDNSKGDGSIHPLLTASRYAPVSDKFHAMRLCFECVYNLSEPDYGDFMRAANSYLCKLVDDLEPVPNPIRNKIAEMQRYLLYEPTGDVQRTQRRLLRDLQVIQGWYRSIEELKTTERREFHTSGPARSVSESGGGTVDVELAS
ncbi:MAG: hypothetical protein N2578_10300 [Bdellovibrionaceae bacterium]|nr:hypothetical protein [Pseudobdellovibrionaceae bacterium]